MQKISTAIAIVSLATCLQGCHSSVDTNTESAVPDTGTNTSLPTAASGERPGPAVLYQPLPVVPELSVNAPFTAKPLLISGTDAYCHGEYLYQDYLFDDHGANTAPTVANGGEYGLFPPAGDIQYPTDAARFAGNAADIVEFRVLPTASETIFRITFNTVVAIDAPAIGIGIAREGADASMIAWPNGAGLESPGLDTFITAWGTGGEIVTRSAGEPQFGAGMPLPGGAVTLDLTTNQLMIRVPRSMLEPTGVWRVVAGAGLWNNERGFVPVVTGFSPTETAPASGSILSAPAIFNLAFRFDEPQGLLGSDTLVGYGNWFDELQAAALTDGNSGDAFAEIDFAQLAGTRDCKWIHAPGRDQARIHASRLEVPEGVHAEDPLFGGRLQPYMLHLPPPSDERPGLTLALHGNSANYTQWHTVGPNFLKQIGDDRNHVILSPLGRSTNGSGVTYDWFEAWADVAHHFELDPERTTMSGYSAGGYSTFVLASTYPDLFGSAFAIVGAARLLDGAVAGDITNYIPHMRNIRWVPLIAWNQAVDELAPYVGIVLTELELNRRGLRHEVYTFAAGEHFTPGLLDQWIGARDYLGTGGVTRDPYRVDYTIAPETWEQLAADYGADTLYPIAHLVADHAYWVSGLRTRDEVRDSTGTIRGSISAVSRAFGQGDPETSPVVSVYPGPPQPATINGTEWGPLTTIAAEDRLDIEAVNLSSITIDVKRARLTCGAEVNVQTDGPLVVTLAGCNRELTYGLN